MNDNDYTLKNLDEFKEEFESIYNRTARRVKDKDILSYVKNFLKHAEEGAANVDQTS